MPWGTVIFGMFFCGGAIALLNHFVTGTTGFDNSIRLVVPIAIGGITVVIALLGITGGR